MATIRSNLNSVSSTASQTTFKKCITTCFQNWRHTTADLQTYQELQQQEQQRYHYHSFIEKANENLKSFRARIKKLFSLAKKPINPKKTKNCSGEGQKVQLVAKLLASTFIATTTTTTTSTTSFKSEQHESTMTVMTDSFLQVLDEFPDLNSEVRSILLARAQDGATISDIKEDYRKNTGMNFPIYNNVTDYLLSIPMVSAVCSEIGTRIFNIMPTEKTKHLYDLVRQQKPSPAVGMRNVANILNWRRAQGYGDTGNNNNNNNLNNNNNNMNNVDAKHAYSWRYNNYQPRIDHNNVNSNQKHPFVAINEGSQQQDDQFACVDKNNSQSDWDVASTERNYYQDNCSYLYNRLCNQPNPSSAQVTGRNYNSNSNDVITSQQHNCNYNVNPTNKLGNYPPKNLNSKRKPSNPFRKPLQLRQSYSPTTKSDETMYTSDSDYEAHLLDFPLLGDDFFLYLARMELKCKFKKFVKVLQSGLCVSGQTITAATRRIRQLRDSNAKIIVNIGSVDIMQGRPLVQIEHDFRELVNVMHKKGINPILTTLAPLANYAHDAETKDKVERFNEFIKRLGHSLVVIDIWSCLVNRRKLMLFDCYQNAPRSVTGTVEPYVFWNKIGRQRVLQLIESKLEY